MRTIAHLSDLHFGSHDPVLAEALAAGLRESVPDLVIISGDLTQRARRSQFEAARDFFRQLPTPLLAVPGNHDVPLYDVARRFLQPLDRYRRYICPELQPFFCDAEIAVLGLNTARSATLSNGRISYRQATALRARFADVPADRFRILVSHHPLMPPPDSPDLPVVGRAAMAVEAAGEAGIQLVLAGHHHHAFTADLAGHHLAMNRSMLIVEAGTAISLRRRGEPNSYNLLTIAPGCVDCVVQLWRGDRFAPAAAVSYALVDGRWRREP
jgi:3',5'-cyclic AMP phosphodiesterase CpdA